MWNVNTGKKSESYAWCPMVSEGLYTPHHCLHPDKADAARKLKCACNKVERGIQPPKGCPLLAGPLVKTTSWDSQ